MSRLPAPDRHRLAGPIGIAVIALAILGVLVLLFPSEKYLSYASRVGYGSTSLSYLEALLHVQPDDQALRLVVGDHQRDAGKFDQARNTLAPLLDDDVPAAWFARSRTDFDELTATTNDAPAHAAAYRRTLTHLEQIPADVLTEFDADQLERIAGYWLGLDHPGEAAEIHARLARRAGAGSAEAFQWWMQAGRWWLAAHQPEAAIRAWTRAVTGAAPIQDRLEAARHALQTARMLDSYQALSLVRHLLTLFPEQAWLLAQAQSIALAARQPQQAQQWARAWVTLEPDNDAALRALSVAALANGNTRVALEANQLLLHQHPTDIDLLMHVGQLLEWTQQPEQAMRLYLQLVDKHPGPRLDRRIIQVGRQTFHLQAVARALARQNRRQRLTADDMTLFVDLTVDHLGQPRQAARVLADWVSDDPDDYDLWQRLAMLYEYMNQPDQALATWRQLADIHGMSSAIAMAMARVDVHRWRFRAALDTMTAWSEHAPSRQSVEPTFWRSMGSLAWHLNDLQTARQAYRQLYRQQPDPTTARRLEVAALRTGHLDRAAQLLLDRWPQYPDADDFMTILYAAQDQHRDDILHKLFAQALEAPEPFRDNIGFWLARGMFQTSRGHTDHARAAYRHALTINPESTGAMTALLWLLIDAGEHVDLRHHLARWQSRARHDPELQEAYAVGYSELGQPDQALHWFALLIAQQPRNYLWLLAYADALDAARHFDAGYRIRRYALIELRPQILANTQADEPASAEVREQNRSFLRHQHRLMGSDRNLAWLLRILSAPGKQTLDDTDRSLLVDWHLSANESRWARFWLLRQRLHAARIPQYQKLTIALARNDHRAIGRILAHPQQLAVADRVDALERIGQHDKSLLLALNHINARPTESRSNRMLAETAARLYADMPHNAGFGLDFTHTDNLHMHTERIHYMTSTPRWTVTLEYDETRYRSPDTSLNDVIAGVDRGVGLTMTHRGRRQRTALTLGHVQAPDDAGFTQAELTFDHALTPRLDSRLFVRVNEQTPDSTYFRVLGLRNSLGASVDYALTSRDHVSFTAQGLHYQSRRHESLGHGFALSGQFGRALRTGRSYQVEPHFDVSWTHNSLKHHMPPRLGARLPAGATMPTLLPDDFASAGLGLTLSHGRPGSTYPQAGAPRYLIDIGFEYDWPDNTPGMTFHASTGIPIVGSDELSLFVDYGRTRNMTGGTTRSLGMQYNYFFGK